ncbi:hypothetical protein AMD27_17715 (plasmid) [Acinetobacter sp. TGL-Y2]|uniref:hypothetical protein n=1 Tax=Acinetobacter sp. TGL-Y2 TaxID=1407071 RepID=UPI0007A65A85|nr:hypothetical protein [Acinetobacter sp. TGL-Y2]AMW80754.1 hypothetical protein AMD27_17715 [Acinetobacter sp. TGL-Y2]
MNPVSNLIHNAISSLFLIIITSMIIGGLVFAFFTQFVFLGMLSIAIGISVMSMCYSLANFENKELITKTIVLGSKVFLGCVFAMLALYAANFTYELALSISASYGFLTFFSLFLGLIFSVNVYINTQSLVLNINILNRKIMTSPRI